MPKLGRGGQEVIKDFGKPKDLKEKIQILNGRYGVYVKCGKINVSLPKDTNLEKFQLDNALILLEEKMKDKKISLKKNNLTRKNASIEQKNKNKNKNKNKKIFDLREYVNDKLVELNVKVDLINRDTYREKKNFFY